MRRLPSNAANTSTSCVRTTASKSQATCTRCHTRHGAIPLHIATCSTPTIERKRQHSSQQFCRTPSANYRIRSSCADNRRRDRRIPCCPRERWRPTEIHYHQCLPSRSHAATGRISPSTSTTGHSRQASSRNFKNSGISGSRGSSHKMHPVRNHIYSRHKLLPQLWDFPLHNHHRSRALAQVH